MTDSNTADNTSSLQATGTNLSSNENNNVNTSTLDNAVTSSINLDITAPSSTPTEMGNLNLDNLDVQNQGGNFLLLPDMGTQTLDGNGNIFQLDQVNSLVANNSTSDISLSNTGDHLFDGTSLAGAADGGIADGAVGASGTETGAASATAGVTANLDALTQSIVLGANIQYNNFNLSVIGGDSSASASVSDSSLTHHHS